MKMQQSAWSQNNATTKVKVCLNWAVCLAVAGIFVHGLHRKMCVPLCKLHWSLHGVLQQWCPCWSWSGRWWLCSCMLLNPALTCWHCSWLLHLELAVFSSINCHRYIIFTGGGYHWLQLALMVLYYCHWCKYSTGTRGGIYHPWQLVLVALFLK